MQVEVYINGITSKCSGDCGFEWSEEATPVVTGISPSQGAFLKCYLLNRHEIVNKKTTFYVTVTQNTLLLRISDIKSNILINSAIKNIPFLCGIIHWHLTYYAFVTPSDVSTVYLLLMT